LLGENTLLQATVQRLGALDHATAPIVVCNDEHRFMVARQLEAINVAPSAILLEPVARNTAPAIAAAAFEALAQSGDGEAPILLVLPADHVIRDEARFAEAVRRAVREACAGRIATIGVTPAYPETGYGYIKAGAATGAANEARVVEDFVEKPDTGRATALIEAGDHYWNSGMFVVGATQFLQELAVHATSIRDAAKAAHDNAVRDLAFLRLDVATFSRSPSISVDYALMEQTANAVVVPMDAGWSDIGSWASLSALFERDQEGNTTRGHVVLAGTRNTCVLGAHRVVAAVGVTDSVIVDTADALLVASKSAVQDVKTIVEQLKHENRDESMIHRKAYRPWGSYDAVYSGDGFKIKHLTVDPGHRLSLQMHQHRAEHWIVVRGIARVTRGDETFIVTENESTYIPQRVRHRLENAGTVTLELIEVQSGSYLGEDDIVRFDDAYGRVDRGPRQA